MNLENTEELVRELEINNEEKYDDSSILQDEHHLQNSNTTGAALGIRRKRTREAILEVQSLTELSYVIETYRCVAILYQDGSEVRKIHNGLTT